MRLYTSNRAETLVARLAEVVRRPSGGPFEPEVVLVHSPGMGSWLSQRIAEHVGICANVDFPFPSAFVPRLFVDVLGEDAEGADQWTRSRIQWAVLAELPGRLREPEFAPVRNYLREASGEGSGGGGDGTVDALKTMQLASRIARVFTGYLYYRPAMVERWQSQGSKSAEDPTERWQAVLWNGVRERLAAPNVVELAQRFRQATERLSSPPPKPAAKKTAAKKSKVRLDQLALDFGALAAGEPEGPAEAEADDGAAADAPAPKLPTRVCVFGVSSLPPLQLQIIGELAKLVDVHLFVLSPSNRFFADIRDARAIARHTMRFDTAPADEHLEVGNPLLASLGRLGRDFQHLLYDTDLPVSLHAEEFIDPMGAPPGSTERQPTMFPRRPSALQVLQSDVLHLRHRGYGSPSDPEHVPVFELDDDDRSVVVHSCHGPMRQVEVLHDQLLDLFRRDPALTPAEVVVMCPDLETYGPLVEAVFERGPEDTRSVPFRISDRSLRRESPTGEAFLALLDLLDGRLGAPDVMDFLSMPLVHRRFGIGSEDLPRVAEWIRETGIRWGVDADHRESHGQPPYEENTWRFGLDRMLLGTAMIGEDRRLFAGVLPYDRVEGSSAGVVGRLAEFATTLFDAADRLAEPRPLPQWRDDLGDALDALVANDDEVGWQHEQIRRILSEAADEAEDVGVRYPFPLVAIRNLLREALTEGRSPHGFVSGAVTFCEMLPMRAIPFRVVAMLGMDERSFPRNPGRMRFDLVSRHAARGDRNSRDDDRYLFLEALLSARDRVLITFTGQSVRDNSPLPPSVAVSELLDVCTESFGAPQDRFVVRHALQPFSERYFRTDDPLFTYAHEFHSGAESLRAPVEPRRPFLTGPAPLEEALDNVSTSEFVRFFHDPVRYFFNRRLEVYLEEDDVALLAREPIVLDRLESSILAGRMLDRAAAGEALAEGYEPTRAEGALPLGHPGAHKYEAVSGRVEPLERAVAALRGLRDPGSAKVDIEVSGLRITGRIQGLFDDRLVHHQYARVRGDHELRHWVQHLLLSAADAISESLLIGRPGRHSTAARHGSRGLDVQVLRFRRPDDPIALLAPLVELFRTGQQEPLLLFPQTGLVWQELADHKDQWRESSRAWEGPSRDIPGEMHGPYAMALLGGIAPFRMGREDGENPVLGGLPSRPSLAFRNLAPTVFGPLLAHRS